MKLFCVTSWVGFKSLTSLVVFPAIHCSGLFSVVILMTLTDGVSRDKNVRWLIMKMQYYVHHVTLSKPTN